MADTFTPITEQTAGTLDKIDMTSLTVGGNTVFRQRINIADPSTAAALAAVSATALATSAYGLAAILHPYSYVGGYTSPLISTEIIRPADTTAYAVGDSVNTSTSAPTIGTLAAISRTVSGSGYLTYIRLLTNQLTNIAAWRVHFYTVNNPTLTNDNTAFKNLYTDKNTWLGSIDLPAMTSTASGSSDNSFVQDATIRFPYVADASSNLYFLLETRTSFTPTSGQKFYLTVGVENN